MDALDNRVTVISVAVAPLKRELGSNGWDNITSALKCEENEMLNYV